jgi:hypothetical protein
MTTPKPALRMVCIRKNRQASAGIIEGGRGVL